MKIIFVATALLAVFTGMSFAEMKIPRSVYKMDELDEAIAKATDKEKPLVIVYTNPGTT